MNSLPSELYDHILRQLDLNDLARCRRVSRGLHESAHRVLSAITSVHRGMDFSFNKPINKPNEYIDVTLALRDSAVQYTVCRAEFTKRRTESFLRFVTKYCTSVSSLVAASLTVDLEDISPLAQRLTMFSLYQITSSGFLMDEKLLAAHFPNLQFYCLIKDDVCPHRVMREYSSIPSNQFAQYDELCFIRHACGERIDVRSIESLQFIRAHSLDLCQLRPSSLNSLKYLHIHMMTLSSEHLPPLPNLLDVSIGCDHCLKNLIRMLHNSNKLLSASFAGGVDSQSVEAVQLLLSKCRALQRFALRRTSSDEHVIGDANEHILDLSQASSLRKFIWSTINVPMEVILPSRCQKIEIIRNSVGFSIDGRSFDFDESSVFFSRMSVYEHPVKIMLHESSEKLIDRVIPLCPQVNCLKLHQNAYNKPPLASDTLEKILAKTDISEFQLIGHKRELDESNLVTFFSAINKYPKRFFFIELDGFLKSPLEQMIESVVTRPFIIDDEADEDLHFVRFHTAVGALPSANSE